MNKTYVVIYCKNARMGSFEFKTTEERDSIVAQFKKDLVLSHVQTDITGTIHYNASGVKPSNTEKRRV